MESFVDLSTFVKNTTDGPFQDFQVKKIVAKVLSDQERLIFEAVFYVSLSGFVGSFGVVANTINIVVFYKQGFTNTVNIAFFGLANSDLWCLVFLVWASFCTNPLLPSFGVRWVGIEVMYFSAGWPHLCFCRITSYITVYITGERYLSIALPFKIKQLVTKARTTAIICLIYLLNILSIVPEWVTSNLRYRFVEERNATFLTVVFTSSRKGIQGICFVIHSMISMASFFGVVFFSCMLAVRLRQSSQLRNELTSVENQKGSMSGRDKKTVKMIVLIASILIVCYIPGAIAGMTIYIVGPEFNIQGGYSNICTSIWGIAFFFQSINSSVNMFIYYRMSSKYKQTFHHLFPALFNHQKVPSDNA